MSTETLLADIRRALGAVIRGKAEVIDRLLVGLLAGGHVLLEDVPGTGKTTLSKALAKVFSIDFTRVQFTPDLLPSDILGGSILDPKTGKLEFSPGPVFTNVLLADEINRASPRTQSALLEAMSEAQVSIDGKTHALPTPFFVLATQNPVDFQGTYPLPEAQLDRFMLKLAVGYPPRDEEVEVLFAQQREHPLARVEAVADRAALLGLMAEVREVEVKRPVAEYLVRIAEGTRAEPQLELGMSTRGVLALFRACQARALLAGRRYVSPEDAYELARHAIAHRVVLGPEARYGGATAELVLRKIIERTEAPT